MILRYDISIFIYVSLTLSFLCSFLSSGSTLRNKAFDYPVQYDDDTIRSSLSIYIFFRIPFILLNFISMSLICVLSTALIWWSLWNRVRHYSRTVTRDTCVSVNVLTSDFVDFNALDSLSGEVKIVNTCFHLWFILTTLFVNLFHVNKYNCSYYMIHQWKDHGTYGYHRHI